jgi:hypothetical protein
MIRFLINAGIAQLVERQPSKLNVASSSLVSRSNENAGFQVNLEAFYFRKLIFVNHPVFGGRIFKIQGENAKTL